MNILVFSRAAWDTTNSFGNTASNFFEEWTSDYFAHFYIRKQKPNNTVADVYYNISAKDVLKELFCLKPKTKVIRQIEVDTYFEKIQKDIDKEKNLITKVHSKKNNFIYWITEQIWMSKAWMKSDFRDFVKELNPDIFFAFAANSYILSPLIDFIKKETNAKIVLFIADDVYRNYNNQGIFRRGYLKKKYRKCMKEADLVYAITTELKKEYSREFNRDIRLICKGCDLSSAVTNRINSPLRFVYAGNLLYGRQNVLCEIANIIEKINEEEYIAKLEIYTPAIETEELKEQLNRGNSSRLLGSRPYNEIKEILNEADIVLQIESFEQEYVEMVKYSFSTKIIDCLQSGSGVLAIGPPNIASIEYMRSVDGIWVIDDIKNLEEQIREIICNASQIPKRALSIREYALEKHDIKKVRENLRQDFKILIVK